MPALMHTNPTEKSSPCRVSGRRRCRRIGFNIGLSMALLGVCLASTGCMKSIYRRGDPRTQYDRYDASRNQFASDYVEDEYGRLEPNLRGRLLVKN